MIYWCHLEMVFYTNFRDKKLPEAYALLDKYRNGKTVVIFKSREDADDFTEGII